MQGSVIGTLGNFSASIGKAKSKKTFNVSAIVAAALKNGTVLNYTAELPENKRNDDDFASYLRNGSVYPPAFLDAVCCGYAAPEQPGYAAYPVHILLFVSDFPSESNREFAKEMRSIFR